MYSWSNNAIPETSEAKENKNTQAMPSPTVNNDTARELFDQIVGKHHRELAPLNYENVMEFARKISSLTWDAAIDAAIKKFEHAKTKAQTLPELVYLDATLAILDTIKTAPDKETYMNNLFEK